VQIPPREVNWCWKGKWLHHARVALEKHSIRKFQKGSTERVYASWLLEALGIERLKDSGAG
jgi:sulfide:quinone oxidoreductase